jgi:hypothetical protein
MSQKCGSCGADFDTSKNSHPVVFCPPCRKIRNLDVCEIITSNGIIYCSNINEAESLLSKMPATLRLDLHHTLDTVDSDFNVFADSCCISYVGKLTDTRLFARLDILDRIQTGQIKYGALVFKRGNSKSPDLANKFVEPGSKAWFNKIVPVDSGLEPLFIDDSEDHVKSVSYAGIRSIQIFPNDKLTDLIEF